MFLSQFLLRQYFIKQLILFIGNALFEGICEPMTISRFENGIGKHRPEIELKPFLQRLGLPDDRF